MNFRLQLPPDLTACAHSAMATEFVFHLGGHGPTYLRQAASEAFALIDQLEARLSFYRESSDVTRLNRASAGTEVSVSPDTLACLALAAEAARLTGGAFNAFTGRASVSAKKQAVPLFLADAPEPAEAEVALERSGRRPCLPLPLTPQAETPVATSEYGAPGPVVSLHPKAGIVGKLRAGPWLDLGALGKGYALDQAAALLAEWDITTGCLIAGGSSLRGLGGAGWSLEIDQAKAPLPLPGEFCLGASGFQFQPGHIIDSRPLPVKSATGRAHMFAPSTTRALVLAPSAALADALSTAALLLTPEQLAQLTRDQPAVASLVVDAIGQRHRHGAPFA